MGNRRAARTAAVVTAALAGGLPWAVSCGPPTPVTVLPGPAPSPSPSPSPSTLSPRGPSSLPAVALGSFGVGTFGPRVVRGPKGSLMVSAPRATSGRRWMAQPLDKDDRPASGQVHEVAEAPEDTSTWDLQPVGDVFVLAWTRSTDTGMQLLVVGIGSDGAPRGSATAVARSGDELGEVRVLPLGAGASAGDAAAVLAFGEKSLPKGATAAVGTLRALALDAQARPLQATATVIADRLSAWQIVPAGPSIAIAGFVQRSVDSKAKAPATGSATTTVGAAAEETPRVARFVSLGLAPVAKGAAAGETDKLRVVASDPVSLAEGTALPEITVGFLGAGRALAVFADRRELDAHLFSAAIDVSTPKPKLVAPPKRTVTPRGDMLLSALLPTPSAGGGAVLLWEAVHPRPTHEARRRFELVRLTRDGEASGTPRAVWFPYEDNEPDIALVPGEGAAMDDVAMLTYGRACVEESPSVAWKCDHEDLRPFVLRFSGPSLAPRDDAMLEIGKIASGPVKHAFELSCDKSSCEALVEGPGDPTTVALVKLDAKRAPSSMPRWAFAEHVAVAEGPPRLESASTLARESQFAGLHATRAGSGTLVSWITYFSEDEDVDAAAAPAGKDKAKAPKKPPKKSEHGARVATRMLDAGGEPSGPVTLISERGLSKGDVAVAWSALDSGGGVVAYVSRAEGDEEVYVARLDASGKKVGGSTRITNAAGAASDVALTALPAPDGGFLLGWIDGRKANPAVYAVRLDKSGGKVGGEVKIGGGLGGDLSDLALATVGTGSAGPRVLAAWSDSRDDATAGFGDLYVATVAAKDLGKPLVAEKAVAKTKLHSHSPTLSARSDGGAVIGWLEDDPSAGEMLELVGKPEWGAYVARLDATGTMVGSPIPVAVDAALGKGVVTGIAADCAGTGGCRFVLAWSDREGIALLGTTLAGVTLGVARPTWSYHGAPTQEVSPALVGSSAFLCEDGLEKDDGRVRRLGISW